MTTESRGHIRWFRNTAPYINAHRDKTFVLMLGGDVAQHQNFANIIHDIALLNSLGIRLVLVHGARPQIEDRLKRAGITSEFHEGVRITDNASIEHVRDAAGALRAQFEALLSMGLPNSPMQGSSIRVCSGNFVTAKPMGIVNGIDYHLTGQVRGIDVDGVRTQLDAGSIVLLSPLGYSPTGEIFNLSLADVAVQCAAAIGADKLLLFGEQAGVRDSDNNLVRQCTVGEIASLEVTEPAEATLLATAQQACLAGVPRCQIISFSDDCALLEELFTHDGSGTLVANDDYEQYGTRFALQYFFFVLHRRQIHRINTAVGHEVALSRKKNARDIFAIELMRMNTSQNFDLLHLKVSPDSSSYNTYKN